MSAVATLTVATQSEAQAAAAELANAALVVAEKRTEIVTEAPPPPYSTAALLADATARLGWESERVMVTAQALFEGIELNSVHTGLITYHRTDSLHTDPEAIAEAREVIARLYGSAALPKQPWQHGRPLTGDGRLLDDRPQTGDGRLLDDRPQTGDTRRWTVDDRPLDTGTARPETGKGAGWLGKFIARLRPGQGANPQSAILNHQSQEAHEAIRPTSAARTPEKLAEKLDADGLALYELIWQRFIASQMKAARYRVISIEIEISQQ